MWSGFNNNQYIVYETETVKVQLGNQIVLIVLQSIDRLLAHVCLGLWKALIKALLF